MVNSNPPNGNTVNRNVSGQLKQPQNQLPTPDPNDFENPTATQQANTTKQSQASRSRIARPTFPSSGPIVKVADLAARCGFKIRTVKGKTEYYGANPTGNGATKDGFVLFPDGTVWDRKLQKKYTSYEVAQMFGIDPNQYEPIIEYRTHNNHYNAPACPSRASLQTVKSDTTPNSTPKRIPSNFNWDLATKYPYTDESGNLIFEVGRIDYPDHPKAIRQRRPDGDGGWVYGLGEGLYEPTIRDGVTHWYGVKANPSVDARQFPETRRVLYGLPDVLVAEIVIVCEGEKVTDALNHDLKAAGRYGKIVATTTSQGASNAHKTDLSPLQSKKLVVILPDNDEAGEKYRDSIRKVIHHGR